MYGTYKRSICKKLGWLYLCEISALHYSTVRMDRLHTCCLAISYSDLHSSTFPSWCYSCFLPHSPCAPTTSFRYAGTAQNSKIDCSTKHVHWASLSAKARDSFNIFWAQNTNGPDSRHVTTALQWKKGVTQPSWKALCILSAFYIVKKVQSPDTKYTIKTSKGKQSPFYKHQ